MRATRWNIGTWVFPRPTRTTDVAIFLDRDSKILDEPLRPEPRDSYLFNPPAPAPGSFDTGDFGDRERLTWAGGACAIPKQAKLMYWDQRFAVWTESDALAIVDATRNTIVRLTQPTLFRHASLLVHGGRLWVTREHGPTSFELPDLVALFDQPSGPVTIEVAEKYPCHRPKRTERARIIELHDDDAIARTTSNRTSRVRRVDGLELDMEVTLHDELWIDLFCDIELPGRPRATMYSVPTARSLEARLEGQPAIDPAGPLVIHDEAPPRQGDIDSLYRQLADEPDDDATRSVLVDLLEESGEPYAPALAALIRGASDDEALRREVLGPLSTYLSGVEYHRGLPHRASLRDQAPLDDALAGIVANDLRLGLFRELRLAGGAFRVYATLVGSPRAVGLRHVDVPNSHVLAALIAARRTELTELSSVRFSTKEMIAQLAHPTFDRVTTLHMETTSAFVAKLLDFITRDEQRFFARTPRHVVLYERDGLDDTKLREAVSAAWSRLPLAKVTVGDLTFER